MKCSVMKKELKRSEISEMEWYNNLEGKEECMNHIYKQISDAYDLINEFNIEEVSDVFGLDPTQYSWVKIINIILDGLCLEQYYVNGVSYSVSLAEEHSKEHNHHCKNDKYVGDEEFGIGNCDLYCQYRVSDEDGFCCQKHGRWLSPSLPNGEWFSGQGLVLF